MNNIDYSYMIILALYKDPIDYNTRKKKISHMYDKIMEIEKWSCEEKNNHYI